MKKLSLLILVFFVAVGFMAAQRTVSGVITDDTGEPLIGANVLVKGTSAGTITDIDGKYSLDVPEGGTTLVISYTGFITQDVELGSSNEVNVTLSEGVELGTVVVTGLGIKKEKKALGYAVTTIGSADVELKPEADIARVLRGKVPGVEITSTSGLAGSGTNVIIRGYSSITGDNQPLFVVDGVPFNAETNSDRNFVTGGATASSRFLDLNPNNIAEVSILKGLSATVLYGEAGRNGVVLVTTKNTAADGSKKKFEITLDQSIFATKAASIPDDQDKYGNGWQNRAIAAFSNWGAPFDQPGKNNLASDGTIPHPYDRAALNSALPQYQGARYDYKPYDNLQQFFTTGTQLSTSLNIATALNHNTSLNFNYGFLNDEGFIPNNNLDKHNFGVGLRTDLENGFSLVTSFNFTTYERNTPPASIIFSSNPAGGGSSLFSNVLYTPRSVDLFGLEYANPVDNTSIFYRSGNDIQHPLWTLNNVNDNEKLRRFFGTMSLSYELTDQIGVSYRLGLDSYTQRQRYTINKGGRQDPDGRMESSERLLNSLDQTFSLNGAFNLSNDFTLDGVVGFNVLKGRLDFTFTQSTEQFVYDLFTHNNYINHSNSSFHGEETTMGAFGTFTLGYRSMVYLNLQGRNDWTSTLEPENNSIFYPSASLSFIASEAIAGLQNNEIINYLKFRVGYGTSAGYPDPYQTRNVLNTSTRVFQTNGGTILNTNSVSNQFGNPDLKPEKHSEVEFGLDGRFLNNKIIVDFSVYNKQSDDLIIALELDPATGGTNTTVNAASVENKGIELGVNVRPFSTQDFYWDFGINFTDNSSNVLELIEGIDQLVIDGFTDLGNFAIPGMPYGVIQGTQILRDEVTGRPIVGGDGAYQQAAEIGVIADPNPDYRFNWNTTIAWKDISLRMQMDYVKGGQMWASTPSTLYGRGILQETGEFDRFVPVIVPGLKELPDGTLVENDIQITANKHFWTDAGVFYDENRIFDATVLRLREIAVSFDLPEKVLANTPFGSAALTFSGQNLWYKAYNVPAGANYDPEVSSLGVGNGRGFDYVTGPTSKKYGASLRITF